MICEHLRYPHTIIEARVTEMFLYWCWFAGYHLARYWQGTCRLWRLFCKRLLGSKPIPLMRFMVKHKRIIRKILAVALILIFFVKGSLNVEEILVGVAINLLSD